MEGRRLSGLEGLVGGLQAVIINTEEHLQKAAAEELIRYSGLRFQEAFMDAAHKTCVLKVPGSDHFRSADFLIRSRLKGRNPFLEVNAAPKSSDLPNTRLETFVFETSDIERYVSLQAENVKFQSGIIDLENYYFIQTMPSRFTGNSLGFIEWKGEKGVYSSSESQRLDWNMETPKSFPSTLCRLLSSPQYPLAGPRRHPGQGSGSRSCHTGVHAAHQLRLRFRHLCEKPQFHHQCSPPLLF